MSHLTFQFIQKSFLGFMMITIMLQPMTGNLKIDHVLTTRGQASPYIIHPWYRRSHVLSIHGSVIPYIIRP